MARGGYVYILASRPKGTLYVGVTSDITRRMWEHQNGLVEGFTSRYGVCRLVYAEACDDIRDGIAREKQLKKWRRAWKIDLIEQVNPERKDLYEAQWQTVDPRVRGDDGVGKEETETQVVAPLMPAQR